MRRQLKFNILAALIFWIPVLFFFGFWLALKHLVYVAALFLWGVGSIALSTWIGEKTFDRGWK